MEAKGTFQVPLNPSPSREEGKCLKDNNDVQTVKNPPFYYCNFSYIS
jgi:hypothetical protein